MGKQYKCMQIMPWRAVLKASRRKPLTIIKAEKGQKGHAWNQGRGPLYV